jgi:hypothetical protein
MALVGKFVVFVVIIFSPSLMVLAQDTKMSKSWFINTHCNEIILKKLVSISNDKVLSEVSIRDKSAIKNIMERIEKIPVNGEEMKSFGSEAENIELMFSFENNQTSQIDIINKRFKTPSTGFNPRGNEIEASLYKDIDGLLFPEVEKTILKVENLEIDFGNFKITYLNTDYIPQKPGGPTIGPVYIMNFLVKDEILKVESKLAVYSAQLPPQPLNFEINKKQFILLTYVSKNEERIYPNYFQVIEAHNE